MCPCTIPVPPLEPTKCSTYLSTYLSNPPPPPSFHFSLRTTTTRRRIPKLSRGGKKKRQNVIPSLVRPDAAPAGRRHIPVDSEVRTSRDHCHCRLKKKKHQECFFYKRPSLVVIVVPETERSDLFVDFFV